MNQFLLSIIIPAYNCESYIESCIQSVMCQLPDCMELVVVDDGSEDHTREKLSHFENLQENLVINYSGHKGASGARNKGLDLARGEYVSFLDCDDCICEGFLKKALPLFSETADLYIFGIRRIPLSGDSEIWGVKDHVYPDNSAFADEYIRVRNLMIYSNCNKFYRREIIENLHLRFEETMSFGEDRLFNYKYLERCGMVITSSLVMLDYIQRTLNSQSGRSISGFFDIITGLHEAKMFCFLHLSKGTSEEEKKAFRAGDYTKEIRLMIERFDEHPEEKDENLPKINRLVTALPSFTDGWYQDPVTRAEVLAELQESLQKTSVKKYL